MTQNLSRMRNDRTVYGKSELDSHADTVVLGSNCVILNYTGRECDVSPYTDTYDAIKGVPIIKGATAWTSNLTGETFIMVFNKALCMGKVMEHSLINPNQLRHYGVNVQDNPYSSTQVHISTEDQGFILPLETDGTAIYFVPSRTPTAKELQTCRHITLTSHAEWNPRNVSFPDPSHQVEERLISKIESRREFEPTDDDQVVVSLNPQELVERIISQVMISDVRIDDVLTDVPLRRTFASNERHTTVTAAELSERWCIGLAQATNTIRITTQRGIRSATLPLSRRYKADRVFERPLLRGQFSTDTVDGRCKSMDGNKYAQLFATKDLFVAVYPMEANKSMAGKGLRQFIHEYGRPEHTTFDGSKSEPERPNHNFAEGVIREVRKKWLRIMVKKKVPKRLWDYGFCWVCEIQNRTSNTARGFDGRCPLEKITGESVDITEYLDFGFYDWVWFKENAGLGETKIG
jgi:hypothetical protein